MSGVESDRIRGCSKSRRPCRVRIFSKLTDRVGSGRVGSGRVGSGRVGSGRVGSGRVGSGRPETGTTRDKWPVKDPETFDYRGSRIVDD